MVEEKLKYVKLKCVVASGEDIRRVTELIQGGFITDLVSAVLQKSRKAVGSKFKWHRGLKSPNLDWKLKFTKNIDK